MRILFAGGGTAGHINPAIAVAKYIKNKNPDSEILFVGTRRGLERELVPKEGFEIKYIDVLGFKRSISANNIKAFTKVFGAYAQSVEIIESFKPDVVMGTGGYVSGPVLVAAARKNTYPDTRAKRFPRPYQQNIKRYCRYGLHKLFAKSKQL